MPRRLRGIYAGPRSLYETFRCAGVIFDASSQAQVKAMMDILHIAAIAAFLLATCAFVDGCDRLGKGQ